MDYVNENTTSWISVQFFDRAGTTPTAPASLQYRIDCSTTGNSILPLTSLSPAASVDVPITASQNAMQNPANAMEVRRVTFVAQNVDGSTATFEYVYILINLRFV